MSQEKKFALIIGAGPAGLTAAFELLQKTDIHPIIFEASGDIGGLSKTITYHGNKIDIGGHRFFSKSDRVLNWWNAILPLQRVKSGEQNDVQMVYQQKKKKIHPSSTGPDPVTDEKVMLIRKRVSHIFYNQRFFDYPLSINWNALRNFGILPMFRMGFSYVKARILPIRSEKTLEDFYINRFGQELYRTFFKDYTEKVWGVPCKHISAEWGAQRVKGLSISSVIKNGLSKLFFKDTSLFQTNTQTSLIEQFLYPKYGPGQLWEEVARRIKIGGGNILMHQEVIGMKRVGDRITEIQVKDKITQEVLVYQGDYVFSSMPVKQLVEGLGKGVPEAVKEVARGLVYRDFITVGVLLKRLRLKQKETITDNWMYIQDKKLRVGRIQFFNNWSPYLVKDPETIWLGLEYFCSEGDELWSMTDEALKQLAVQELSAMGMTLPQDVLDSTVIRVKKTYPCYFGSYQHFSLIREYVDKIENLFLIGRNGMHRYNNQDHSMLTAMTAVENIIGQVKTKNNIWSINLDDEYHEEK